MRRVQRSCGSVTPGTRFTISKISFSTSSGNDCSISSPMPFLSRSMATLTMSAPTAMEAMGSSTVQRSPKRMAPPMPMAVPMDDKASLRWCQALAFMTWESSCSALRLVYWNVISFNMMETSAAINANHPGWGSVPPLAQKAIFLAPSMKMPTATAKSAIPMRVVAKVSNLP